MREVRINGVCGFLQPEIDRKDMVFGGTFGMETTSYTMEIKTEWAGYKKVLKGPCRSIPSESELSEDIEFYKEEACIESSNTDFEMSFRNYRAFLLSTIALVDCYINRHIFFYDFKGRSTSQFKQLKTSTNTEERIELFINEFSNFSYTDFKQTKHWENFKRLKDYRNEIVHSLHPYMGVGIKEMATNLNLSINGVGTFLKKLQLGQGRPSLGFIERVRTSPIIHFNQIIKKEGDKYKTKLHRNKVDR